ncbi:cupin domain-containing protein [Oceanobacillus indicireducens]|uniref:Cupin type-2 domain-containing protein n=1 Tax=Oceanobacillus indicireducens TaxID=1004261 RepID=A0A917XV02_9BACI|nr:cupin domain-containing protein [Oceanobacillus indicireducens]GGN52522.1 hypothetical protein GCM10007971_08200 [Oceanobacillus indicireducens]
MIKRSNTVESVENLHGGKGIVDLSRKLTKEDQIAGLDMFAEVSIPVGGSIGFHSHDKDAEAYYIVEGTGNFQDDEGEHAVSKGDLCIITRGGSHGLINTGDEPLKIIAVVWS